MLAVCCSSEFNGGGLQILAGLQKHFWIALTVAVPLPEAVGVEPLGIVVGIGSTVELSVRVVSGVVVAAGVDSVVPVTGSGVGATGVDEVVVSGSGSPCEVLLVGGGVLSPGVVESPHLVPATVRVAP
jgi:hypothetical protein